MTWTSPKLTTRWIAAAAAVLAIGAAAPAGAAVRCDRDPVTGKPLETIVLTTAPAPPATGDNTFTAVVHDAECRPVVGAAVTLELVMPAMPGMPEMRSTVTLAPAKDPKAAAAGTYTGRGQIFMAGRWTATIRAVVKGATAAERTITITAR